MPSEAPIDEIVATVSAPEVVDAASSRPCERYGYVCDLGDASDEQIDAGIAALDAIRQVTEGIDDAREQMRVAAATAAGLDGVGHLEVDVEHATQIAFTINAGPRFIALTDAGILNDNADVPDLVRPVAPLEQVEAASPPDEEVSVGTDDDEPSGITSRSVRPQGVRASSPIVRRYEPTGGALASRSALVINPFTWDSANEIAALFQANDEYSRVDVLAGPEVTPDVLLAVPNYDAVHILSHGGGSCPSWTEDRSECTSTIVGGEWDVNIQKQIQAEFEAAEADAGATFDELADVSYWMCEAGGVIRYCFNSDGFPTNANGITFFGACGSDFGFGGSNGAGGAAVTWTGTTQRLVAERTAAEFWRLMLEEGVEFALASQLLSDGGYDDHKLTWWASGGSVNQFTTAAFSGRNLRARDVIDATFAGGPMAGQVAKVNGSPGDGTDETFPTGGENFAILVEGVRTGSEQGVTIEVRGDGALWKSDIELVRDGAIIEQGDGYATWRVDVPNNAVTIPSLALNELKASQPATEIEIRAYESASEFTAVKGSLRFGADLRANGPLPIFEQLAAGLPAGGEVVGNDLEVSFNSGGGDVTGTLNVELIGQGFSVGEWTLDVQGTFDASSGSIIGDVTATAQSTLPGFTDIGDFGTGQATGSVDLDSGTVTLTLGAGGATQNYLGTIAT